MGTEGQRGDNNVSCSGVPAWLVVGAMRRRGRKSLVTFVLCITDSGTMGAIWNSRSVVAMACKRRPRRRRGRWDDGKAGWLVVLLLLLLLPVVVFLLLGTELEPPSDPDESGIQPAWLSQGACSPSFADGPGWSCRTGKGLLGGGGCQEIAKSPRFQLLHRNADRRWTALDEIQNVV